MFFEEHVSAYYVCALLFVYLLQSLGRPIHKLIVIARRRQKVILNLPVSREGPIEDVLILHLLGVA